MPLTPRAIYCIQRKLQTRKSRSVLSGSPIPVAGLIWYNQSFAQLYPTLAIACFVGIVRAAVVCNFNLCVADQTPPEKLPSALGLFMVTRGLSVLALGPLIGACNRTLNKFRNFLHHIFQVSFATTPTATPSACTSLTPSSSCCHSSCGFLSSSVLRPDADDLKLLMHTTSTAVLKIICIKNSKPRIRHKWI